MSEQPPTTRESTDPAPPPTEDVGDVDVTRYKTKELTDRFQQLFGVSHLLPWAGAGLGGCVLATMTAWAILFLPHASTGVAALSFVYMGLQGFFLGLLAAALLVITRIFQQLTAVVDITLQTLRQAMRDIRNIGDPDVRGELIAALIHGAIMPAVKSAITVKMGLLRAPVGFVLNKLLDRSAKKMTKNLRDKSEAAGELPEPASDDTEATDEPRPERDDDESSPDLPAETDSHLDRMRDRVEVIARRTRRATLIPAVLFFVFVAAVSSLPWVFALPLIFV